MKGELIAPCGMNCNICAAHLAFTHDVKSKGIKMMYCKGCRQKDRPCAFIKRDCRLLRQKEIQYCHECKDMPCSRLSAIDKRYRTQFRMSMLENQKRIRDEGIDAFLRAERAKWKCPKCSGVTSCHNGLCFDCDLETLRMKKRKYSWD